MTTSSPDPVRGLAHAAHQISVPDAVNCDLPLDKPPFARVQARRALHDRNTFYFWIGQHENGRYSKAHAHTSAAVLICIKGKGYTTPGRTSSELALKDGKADAVQRIDFTSLWA